MWFPVKKTLKDAADIETYYLYVRKELIVELKIFNTSFDYMILANSKFPPYYGVKVSHKDKSKCARLAMKRMYELMKE